MPCYIILTNPRIINASMNTEELLKQANAFSNASSSSLSISKLII